MSFNNHNKNQLIDRINNKDLSGAISFLDKIGKDCEKESRELAIKNKDLKKYNKDYKKRTLFNCQKIINFFKTGVPSYEIFSLKGNSKLPFLAFSSLPGESCPGAGDCLNFCYSFKSWRYSSAFFRQLQNFMLLQNYHGRKLILQDFDDKIEKIQRSKKYAGGKIDCRLYVDGDFKNIADLSFWMESLKDRPIVSAYGYSKSFAIFLAYNINNTFPRNYVLNISSGHKYGESMVNYMKELTCTRGEFIAIPAKKNHDIFNVMDRKILLKSFKELTGRKAFACPGKCGDCNVNGHVCGSKDKFNNVAVIIGVH